MGWDKPNHDTFIGNNGTIKGRQNDFTVFCCGEQFAVHEDRLESCAEYFAKGLHEGFPAPAQQVLNTLWLDDENPNIIRAMLRYFYEKKYTVAPDEPGSSMMFHLQVLVMAHRFGADSVLDAAQERFWIDSERDDWKDTDISDMIRMVDETPDLQKRGTLKRLIVEMLRLNLNQLQGSAEFKDFLQEKPHWAIELLGFMNGNQMVPEASYNRW